MIYYKSQTLLMSLMVGVTTVSAMRALPLNHWTPKTVTLYKQLKMTGLGFNPKWVTKGKVKVDKQSILSFNKAISFKKSKNFCRRTIEEICVLVDTGRIVRYTFHNTKWADPSGKGFTWKGLMTKYRSMNVQMRFKSKKIDKKKSLKDYVNQIKTLKRTCQTLRETPVRPTLKPTQSRPCPIRPTMLPSYPTVQDSLEGHVDLALKDHNVTDPTVQTHVDRPVVSKETPKEVVLPVRKVVVKNRVSWEGSAIGSRRCQGDLRAEETCYGTLVREANGEIRKVDDIYRVKKDGGYLVWIHKNQLTFLGRRTE